MNKNLLALSIVGLFFANSIYGQQTVGLFQNTKESYNGYTLFAPNGSTDTYLIDNCGELINKWTSVKRPGLSAYLLENGMLLRATNQGNTTFSGGGSGGGMELLDWSSNVVWSYLISSATECQHHDVEYLPNGNILAIVWDAKTTAEATAAGRTSVGTMLWSEKIVEIKPDLVNGGGTVVWEWKVWDHMVQDVDNGKNNFGNVSLSPELININYYTGNATNNDWLHINGVDYNAELDQIVLSNHNFSELWIIDHSTTTAEAATHSGGNSGKGGDLLYRWGNPQAYDQGTATDQILYKQHDARWIENGYVDSGMIMIFNNQAGSPQNSSAVNVINTPVDGSGKYTYTTGAYAPATSHWTYTASNPTDFYATNISGAHRLPNGNTLICSGPQGEFFEVDYAGKTVWRYINPVGNGGVTTQGAVVNKNIVFRCTRYPLDYAGLSGQTLTQQGYIETGSTFNCDFTSVASVDQEQEQEVSIYPNPATDLIAVQVKGLDSEDMRVQLIDMSGKLVMETTINKGETTAYFDTQTLYGGNYIVRLTNSNSTIARKIVITK